MAIASTTSAPAVASGAATASTSKASSVNQAGSEDRFLKLLVAQLSNQDPMNPMDNAQMTSQMAQISTVSGIEKLNTTVEALNGQFVQMQAVQGAGLVGKDVLLKGDKLSVVDDVPQASFDLDSAAGRVVVEVRSPAGRLVDTLNLGPQSAGRHDVPWPAGKDLADVASYRFSVKAASGSTDVASTSLMRDRIDAVNTGGSSLTLQLERSGRVPYASITALD